MSNATPSASSSFAMAFCRPCWPPRRRGRRIQADAGVRPDCRILGEMLEPVARSRRSRSSAAALASVRAIRPTARRRSSPIQRDQIASSTASIDGVLIVSPVKMPSISLPPLVSRKIFGSGRSGPVALEPLDRARARISTPCPPSPPSTFCQLKVATSILSQAISYAKTALTSRRRSTGRRGRRRSSRRSGTRTPVVVPFQVNRTSFDRVDCVEIADLAVIGAAHLGIELQLLDASVTQPSPKLSQASIVTGREPSMRPHRHFEGAGVGARERCRCR